MEAPLHPTPMQRPMMKGKIYVDASQKPTFQGFWGMTHADVNKSGHTNDFKVVRMESVKEEEIGMPVFAGHYQGYFKLTSGFQTETVNESFTLTFRGHSNHGYNVYGHGENRFGKNEIVGTVTQSGKMEIFKMIPGTTTQPDPSEPAPKLPRPANPRAASPPPPPTKAFGMPNPRGGMGGSAGTPGGGSKPKSGGSTKKKSSSKAKSAPLPPPPSKNGLPGMHVRTLKDCLAMLRKSDKNNVFQFPVPPTFRGLKGYYSDVIKSPMDLGTVSMQIDTKYRTVMECVADVRLVFFNAKDFNPDTDPVHALAASLSGKFEAFLSNHRGVLGLDGSGSAAGSKNSSNPPPPAASMALSASAAGATGKRLGTPPSSSVSAGGGGGGGGAGGGGGGGGGAKGDNAAASGGGGGGGGAAAAAAAPPVLTLEEQDQLAKDVNELFRVGNANPTNERAQARVYALWSFAKAYVEDKDRVIVDGGKGAEIRMDALNHMRQRQLRDVVSFFLEDSKNDPAPVEGAEGSSSGGSSKGRAGEGKSRDRAEGAASSGGPRKRSRSDLSDSDNDEDEEEEEEEEEEEGRDVTPSKRSRDGSGASAGSKGASLSGDDGASKKTDAPPSRGPSFGRVDSSRLTLEATASNLKEADLDLDLGDEDDDEDDDEDGNGDGSKSGSGGEGSGGGAGGDGSGGAMDEQWTQAQAERKEREDRERARAASEKALEEQRLKQQAQREKERVEEGQKLRRERAAEKAKVEAAALEKHNREKKELEDKKEAERLAREDVKASVDLDQVRADSKLMDLMDESVYDD